MRLILFFSTLMFCAFSKAQSTADLKEFINKNNVAIRTVQKNMLRENNSAYVATFKEILKNQEVAVKLYKTDKDASSYFAALVRTESLTFLKSHSAGSVEYFEITEAEKAILKSSKETSAKSLSSSDIKTIEDLDAMNPQSLNNLTLTIQ